MEWRSWFEGVAEFCDTASDRIPVAFILGFYVTLVVGRFWAQLDALPWPSRLAVYVSSMIHDDPGNNRGRMIRRNIMRYLSIAYILTMRDICPPVRKRFKTFQDITEAGNQPCCMSNVALLMIYVCCCLESTLKWQDYFKLNVVIFTSVIFTLIQFSVLSIKFWRMGARHRLPQSTCSLVLMHLTRGHWALYKILRLPYSPRVKCGSQRNHWLFTAFSPGD